MYDALEEKNKNRYIVRRRGGKEGAKFYWHTICVGKIYIKKYKILWISSDLYIKKSRL